MTRMKSLTIGAIATAMILGSSIVFAADPGEPIPGDQAPTDSTVETTTVETTDASIVELANPAPSRRGGGGSGRALKK
jgi:hypothetical protein